MQADDKMQQANELCDQTIHEYDEVKVRGTFPEAAPTQQHPHSSTQHSSTHTAAQQHPTQQHTRSQSQDMMLRMVCQALVDKLMSNDEAEDLTVQMRAAMSEELKMVPYAGARLSVVLSVSSSLLHISLKSASVDGSVYNTYCGVIPIVAFAGQSIVLQDRVQLIKDDSAASQSVSLPGFVWLLRDVLLVANCKSADDKFLRFKSTHKVKLPDGSQLCSVVPRTGLIASCHMDGLLELRHSDAATNQPLFILKFESKATFANWQDQLACEPGCCTVQQCTNASADAPAQTPVSCDRAGSQMSRSSNQMSRSSSLSLSTRGSLAEQEDFAQTLNSLTVLEPRERTLSIFRDSGPSSPELRLTGATPLLNDDEEAVAAAPAEEQVVATREERAGSMVDLWANQPSVSNGSNS